ncbi:hypothetical protein Ae717Ps2_5855 [Pseudonocardia sp. Ae717_Ps2]|nr:hypothetical protein Ae717Ps2_5780 [Pseudonocardia sp. Ae717_Ps2]OLM29099.1 hypothetical protein Ae717Ps2_5855 [Pseudonocardia sp. Ae717_Ps2]
MTTPRDRRSLTAEVRAWMLLPQVMRAIIRRGDTAGASL